MVKMCENCGLPFEAVHADRAQFCSPKCRAAASRARQREAVVELLDEAARAVALAKAVVKGEEVGRR